MFGYPYPILSEVAKIVKLTGLSEEVVVTALASRGVLVIDSIADAKKYYKLAHDDGKAYILAKWQKLAKTCDEVYEIYDYAPEATDKLDAKMIRLCRKELKTAETIYQLSRVCSFSPLNSLVFVDALAKLEQRCIKEVKCIKNINQAGDLYECLPDDSKIKPDILICVEEFCRKKLASTRVSQEVWLLYCVVERRLPEDSLVKSEVLAKLEKLSRKEIAVAKDVQSVLEVCKRLPDDSPVRLEAINKCFDIAESFEDFEDIYEYAPHAHTPDNAISRMYQSLM